MGHTSSRIISYSDAVERLGAEARNYEEGFSRITADSGNSLNFAQFHQRFLLPLVPSLPRLLSERIFASFDVDADNSIDKEEFICSLAVILHGTAEERVRLLFTVYDERRGQSPGTISIAHLERFVTLLNVGIQGGARGSESSGGR